MKIRGRTSLVLPIGLMCGMLQKVGNKSGFQILKRWSHPISNHMYWCASTSGGDQELVGHKWLSIINHVANIHTGHGTRFPACEHGDIGEQSWIEKGSRQHKYLEDMVGNKRLVNDVKQLSSSHQTYLLENFHRGICVFAPKFIHYHHESMKARIYKYIAYRHLARWIWHRLGRRKRRPLPSCAVNKIREHFPSEEYTGFQKARDF
nr:PREDICTED: uncharacterized protein LOC102349191 isoform X2 [Latimeria chalumnae]|eukprot:XP_006001817.1 PREDICTED: uncharacterized protein LOC102349191 isoform X2 [Latimeria chalumnae]